MTDAYNRDAAEIEAARNSNLDDIRFSGLRKALAGLDNLQENT